MKDYNDLLVSGYNIRDLPTEPLDISVLNIILGDCRDKQEEYKKSSSYCKTVKNPMIKSDIADMLSLRWGKPKDEVKDYINIDISSLDEKVALACNIDECFSALKESLKETSTGLGFKSIDESLGGIHKKEVIVLSAFSNHGKSFIAAKIAAYRIIREHNNVLIFSMEMPKGQFLQSIVQEILHMSTNDFMAYVKTDEGISIYSKVKEKIGNHLRIVDEPGKTMDDVSDITEALNNSGFHVDFVIYDHFHIMPGINDIQKFEDESHKMKPFVKRFNLNLLMLAQFNDASQQRGTKKVRPPIPTDIKGSTAIIQDSDIILLVYRPYLMEDNTNSIEREELKYATMIKIGKSRRELMGARLFRYDYNPTDFSLKECV